jgi:hypothetical protein
VENFSVAISIPDINTYGGDINTYGGNVILTLCLLKSTLLIMIAGWHLAPCVCGLSPIQLYPPDTSSPSGGNPPPLPCRIAHTSWQV